MRDEPTLNDIALAALARANEIEAASVAAIEQLIGEAKQRGADGQPTSKAKTARQKLASPALNSTLASVALRDRINPALNTAINQVEKAERELSTAVAALRALQARKELFEGARGVARKRDVSDEQTEPEEWKFVREMRARNVPVSAMGQLTEPELDFIAGLFVEKQKDFKHRDRAGAWWALVRAGLLDVRSEAFDEDERAAILAATDAGAVRARQAYDTLCELAGRQLDVPHSFAEFVLAFAEESDPTDPIGAFERNVTHLEGAQWRADAEKLFDLLGLPMSELSRAVRLMRSPALVSYKEHQGQAHDAILAREAEYQALVDRCRPAARMALAERHDAERRKERERIGADTLGTYDLETALKLLGADDDELMLRNARVILQVRDGTYFSDREAERRRTIEQLAAELAVSPGVRQKVAAMGVRLPEDDGPGAQQVNAPVVEPLDAPIPKMEPVLAIDMEPKTSPATPLESSLAKELGLADDVTPDAAAAY